MTIQPKIPNGWKQIMLKEIGAFSKGSGISKAELVETGINAIRYGELYTRHHFKVKKIHSFIPESSTKTSKKIKYGDIVFAGSGETIDEIGKSAAYLSHVDCYVGGDTIIFTPKDDNSLFLAYTLNVGAARKELRRLGQGQSVVHLYKSDLESVSISLPPLPEQQKIVDVLETWDEYLEKLTKLIKTKKRKKKYLMQQLLSGKLRLNNFSGEWEYIRLSNLAKTSSGGTPKSTNEEYYQNGTIPWLKSGELRKGLINQFKNYITEEGLKNSSAKLFPINTILIAMYGVTAGQIGFLQKEASTNQAICGILPNSKYDSTYLYYFFLTQTDKLLKMGSGAAQPNISQEIIKDYDVFIPKSLEEQTAIANILTTADQEIEALEKKRELIEVQRKFLLNNLVTGKIRLPEFIK